MYEQLNDCKSQERGLDYEFGYFVNGILGGCSVYRDSIILVFCKG